MSDYDYDNAVFRLATAQEAEPEDYTGEDGLLYCGKCRQPKEAYFAEGKTLFGRDRHPKECDCKRADREKREAADREQKHREEVGRLKRMGFTNPAMQEWTFENDNAKWIKRTSMWRIGRIWKRRISATFYGGKSAREKAILPGVSPMPLWSVRFPCA